MTYTPGSLVTQPTSRSLRLIPFSGSKLVKILIDIFLADADFFFNNNIEITIVDFMKKKWLIRIDREFIIPFSFDLFKQ